MAELNEASLVAIGTPLFALLCGSALLLEKVKGIWSFLQVIDPGCLAIVVLTHICEALGPRHKRRGRLAFAAPSRTVRCQSAKAVTSAIPMSNRDGGSALSFPIIF